MSARRLRKRARARAGGQRGVALLMVMGAIAVLTVMLAEFQDETSTELASALAERDALQAEYTARSAVNLARLLVASEPTMRAALTPLFAFMKKTPPQIPVWEFTDQLLGLFNDEDANAALKGSLGIDSSQGKNLGLPGGSRFELQIVDEDAKINVNQGSANEVAHIRVAKEIMGLIVAPQYSAIFEQRDGAGQFHDRMSTCAAIIDWADADDQAMNCDMTQLTQASSAGAEDAYYQVLPKPYRRKNAPYDSLEELHRVRGVSDDFWATFVDPEPENPKKRVMTVWGQGAVNVNTANAQTLYGVVCAGAPEAELCMDPLQSQTFIMGVTMARGITMGAPLFGSPTDFVHAMTGKGMLGPMLASLGMKPVRFRSESDFAKSITIESKVFSIYAIGVKKGFKRETRVRLHAVVDFRTAPALGATAGLAGATGAAGQTTLPTAGALPGLAGQTLPGGTADGFAAALQPSTGGQILYWRLD